MSEVSTSRRDVMRALAILPATIAIPTAASAAIGLVCIPDKRPAWDAAVAVEQAARGAMERFHAKHVAPANDAHDDGTGTFAKVREMEDAWGEYTSAHCDAADAMVATPAPDLEAVAYKLRVAIREGIFDGTSHGESLASAIATDVERLLSGGVA